MLTNEIEKLHLGCFDGLHPGWLNTDATPHIFVSRVPLLPSFMALLGQISAKRLSQHKAGLFKKIKYLDVCKKFPFADNTFSYVFASHMIQKISYEDNVFCTSEIHRVLKPGGCFRVTTPDLDRLVNNYEPENADEFLENFFTSNQRRQQNVDKYHYNEFILGKVLRDCGFEDVYQCEYQQGQCADVATLDNRSDSLFMEAIKGTSEPDFGSSPGMTCFM